MYKTQKTEYFTKWINSLKDFKAKLAIARRIDRAENGNLGDIDHVGDGVFEMRIDFGPGYRVYYIVNANNEIIILLCGGDKSTQKRDISKAKEIAKDYR